MILNTGLTAEAFVSSIATRIAGKEGAWIPADRCTQAAIEPEGVIYLAGGYWRARPTFEGETDRILSLRLINPDRTPSEIAAVERGLAILLHLEYQS